MRDDRFEVGAIGETGRLTHAPGDLLWRHRVRTGAECISLKGGAGWAVGLSIAEVIHPIALNQPIVAGQVTA